MRIYMISQVVTLIRALCLALFLLLSYGAANVAEAQQWKGFLRNKVTNDPEVSAAQLESKAAKNERIGGYMRYMPTLDAFLDYGYIGGRNLFADPNATFVRGSFVETAEEATVAPNRLTWGVVGSLNLFNGMRDFSANSRASAELDVANLRYSESLATSLEKGLKAYLDYWYLLQRYSVASNIVALNKDKLSYVATAVKNRTKTSFDQWQAEIALQKANESLLSVEGDLGDAIVAFSREFNTRAPNNLEPVSLPARLLPANKQQFMNSVKNNSAEFKVANLNNKVADSNYKSSLSNVLPVINLDFSYTDKINGNYNSGRVQEYYAGIGVRWRLSGLYKGVFSTIASKERAQAANYRTSFARRDLSAKAESLWSYYDTGRQRLTLLRSSVESNKKIVDAQRRVQSGRSDSKLGLLEVELRYSSILDYMLRVNLEVDKMTVDVLKMGSYLTVRGLGL